MKAGLDEHLKEFLTSHTIVLKGNATSGLAQRWKKTKSGKPRHINLPKYRRVE